MPGKGPGRSPGGNFVLNEFEVAAVTKAAPGMAKPVKLQNPLASFSQEGFSAAAAIDGNAKNPASGWAIHPALGVTHWATFEASEPVGRPVGPRW